MNIKLIKSTNGYKYIVDGDIEDGSLISIPVYENIVTNRASSENPVELNFGGSTSNDQYLLSITSINGDLFNENIELLKFYPTLLKNGEDFTKVIYEWKLEDQLISDKPIAELNIESMADSTQKILYLNAYIDDKLVATENLTITNLNNINYSLSIIPFDGTEFNQNTGLLRFSYELLREGQEFSEAEVEWKLNDEIVNASSTLRLNSALVSMGENDLKLLVYVGEKMVVEDSIKIIKTSNVIIGDDTDDDDGDSNSNSDLDDSSDDMIDDGVGQIIIDGAEEKDKDDVDDNEIDIDIDEKRLIDINKL